MINIKVKVLTEGCELERHGDWIDLKAAEEIIIEAGDFKMIPLGVAIELPIGHEAHLLPRSSTYKNYGIIMANSMGIIDNAYCGDGDEWHFAALATRTCLIPKGSRIAQFRVVKSMPTVAIETVEHLGNENRGGFGSSGI